MPLFTEPEGRLYKREVATYDYVTSDPLLPDPYEAKMVECRQSRVRYSQQLFIYFTNYQGNQVPFAGTGLFCRIKVEPNTVLAFYNGKRLRPDKDRDHEDWAENAYKIFDPSIKNQTIDIPKLFRFKL